MPLRFRIALWWARKMPRAKGWFPQQVGRRVGSGVTCHMTLPGGAKIAVDPHHLEIYTGILTGRWDADVGRVLCEVVRPGGVLFDIGANSGVMSMEAAQAVNGDLSVIAFEPQPELATACAVSAHLNGFERVRVLRCLLGQEGGEAALFVPQYSVHASVVSRSSDSRKIPCRVYALDELVQSGAIPAPDVIKIDVEGAELDVFRGARGVLKKHKPTILFESDKNSNRFGYVRRDLCDFLRAHADYEFHFITRGGVRPAGSRLEDEAWTDLLAVAQ